MLSVFTTITKSVQVDGLVRPELGTLVFFFEGGLCEVCAVFLAAFEGAWKPVEVIGVVFCDPLLYAHFAEEWTLEEIVRGFIRS